MNTETLQSLVRQILTFVGGFFVARGTITADTLTAIVTNVSAIIGSVTVLVSVWWSWRTHKA
jgi:ABC-type bacteriocin/lantibiotic exporter with double-glycine peptidase domain